MAGTAEPRMIAVAVPAGEIMLKSRRVRPAFEKRLLANIRSALEKRGLEGCRARLHETRILVEECSPREAVDTLLHVFGVHAATEAIVFGYTSLGDLVDRAASIAAEWVAGKRFAVRAKRSPSEPFTSLDLARELGARLKPYSAGVDLENPEVEVYVEARRGLAILHRGWRRGPGGLPTGVEGRALVLFSGGLDSPLAAWMTAKRGAEVDLLHYVLASPASLGDALRVAVLEARLWLHGYTPRLIAVDFRPVTREIAARVEAPLRQLVLRLAMLEAAALMAERLGYDAIVTGESLGQVASQTLRNLHALAAALPLQLPVLRPLIGLDKEEITEWMRRIGLYEEAAKTREYCRITQGPAATRADPQRLRRNYDEIRGTVYKAIEDYVEMPLLA